MKENKPTLELIEGGKGKKGKRSGKGATGNGLTEKQQKFLEGLLAGLSNADAYRQAYDAENMTPNTIYAEASKLAASPKIATILAAELAKKAAKHSMAQDVRRERNSDRIWGRIWQLIDDPSTPAAVKASLLSLGAKAAGMLTEQVRVENVSADSKSIEAELVERLQQLSKSA
jgi:hypothetical protein